ncbi:MAG: hypothetical protein QOF48_1920 [Verrucomicrobiota bacterium]|jgi:hypothetical protein
MRLLVLTNSFPPSNLANAKRPGYLVRGFLDAGWEVDVVSSRLGMDLNARETFVHPALRIRRMDDPADRLTRLFASDSAVFRAVKTSLYGSLWPDECVLWSLRLMAVARKAREYDRVLGFVFPASVLLADFPGGRVDRRWVFDFQEPMSPQQRRHPRRSPVHRLLLPWLTKLERRVLQKAGRVVFTADTNLRTYVGEQLIEKSQAVHVPYFFDAAAFREPAPAVENRFQIVYPGVFDWAGARSPETFLRALALFLERKPEARSQTNFLFHGIWLSEHNRFLSELKLHDVVTLRPPVAYQEYLALLKQSPVLLLVVAAAHNLFMPSKIADYFGAHRPILAFAPRDSEMRRVLEQAGMAGNTNDESDVVAGAASLERLWERFRAGKLAAADARTEAWSSEIQVPRYLQIVRHSTDVSE